MSVLSLFLLFTASIATEGKHAIQPRIVGGTPTTPSDFPYIASILYAGGGYQVEGFCGGSLITSPESATPIVLTAAHCISDVVNETTAFGNSVTPSVTFSLQVDFGRVKRNSDYYNGQLQTWERVEAERWYIHREYDESSFEHDIALIALNAPIDTTSIDVENVTWDVDTTLVDGEWLTIIGYGTNETQNPVQLSYTSSPTLEYLNKSYVTNDECNDLLNLYLYLDNTNGQDPLTYDWTNPDVSLASDAGYNLELVTEDMICAFRPDRDSCQGDSGGPLVRPSSSGDIQVGVVSFGFGCGDYGTPGVYSSVPYHRDWIRGGMACLYYNGGDNSYQSDCEAAETTFGTFISSLDELDTTTTTTDPGEEDASVSLKYMISFFVVLFATVLTNA